MDTTYRFILQREKRGAYSGIEKLIVLLHFVAFIVFTARRWPESAGMASFFGFGIILLYVLLIILGKKFKFQPVLMDVPLYLLVLWWFITGVWYMALLMLIFSIFKMLSKQQSEIIISTNNILFRSILKRQFNWNDVSNVVLKDGMLTIDFKNNKIIQRLIEDSSVDELEFNRFCQHLLLLS